MNDFDFFSAHRTEQYTIDILDKDDQKVDTLDTGEGGTLTFSKTEDIRGGGKLTIFGYEEVPWISHRIMPWVHVTVQGETRSWPLGVFLVTAPGSSRKGVTTRRDLELHDKTTTILRDRVEAHYALPKNTHVITAIKNLLESAGQFRYALTESDAMLTSSLTWEPNTSKLQIINDLLKYINYSNITLDGYGVFQIRPFINQLDRPTSRVFQQGKQAIHKGDYLVDHDIFSIPNKVIIQADGSGSTEGLIGVALANPDSEYSFENLGYWNTVTETGANAESQSVINALAYRRLVELSTPQTGLTIEHLVVPQDLENIVRLVSQDRNMTFEVQQLQYSLTPGSLCTAVWKEVINA